MLSTYPRLRFLTSFTHAFRRLLSVHGTLSINFLKGITSQGTLEADRISRSPAPRTSFSGRFAPRCPCPRSTPISERSPVPVSSRELEKSPPWRTIGQDSQACGG